MNIAQAKQIPLDELLSWLGYEPAKEVNGELWYNSPFRDDDTPSFKLSSSRTAWFDFGDGLTNGGNIIDFALRYYKLPEKDVSGALRELRAFSGRLVANAPKQATQRAENRQERVFKKPEAEEQPTGHILNFEKPFEIWQTSNRFRKYTPLAQYLVDRGIDPEIAAPYLSTIGFSPSRQPEKKWFGVGFRNNSGGFEVRAKFGNTGFKACIGKKDLTFYSAKSAEGEPKPTKTYVFESFLDFVSYLTVFKKTNSSNANYLILNGATLANRGLEAIKQSETHFSPLILFTQLDEAGQEASRKFLELTDRDVLTGWHYYEGYKDLNEALQAKKNKPDELLAKFSPEFSQYLDPALKHKI